MPPSRTACAASLASVANPSWRLARTRQNRGRLSSPPAPPSASYAASHARNSSHRADGSIPARGSSFVFLLGGGEDAPAEGGEAAASFEAAGRLRALSVTAHTYWMSPEDRRRLRHLNALASFAAGAGFARPSRAPIRARFVASRFSFAFSFFTRASSDASNFSTAASTASTTARPAATAASASASDDAADDASGEEARSRASFFSAARTTSRRRARFRIVTPPSVAISHHRAAASSLPGGAHPGGCALRARSRRSAPSFTVPADDPSSGIAASARGRHAIDAETSSTSAARAVAREARMSKPERRAVPRAERSDERVATADRCWSPVEVLSQVRRHDVEQSLRVTAPCSSPPRVRVQGRPRSRALREDTPPSRAVARVARRTMSPPAARPRDARRSRRYPYRARSSPRSWWSPTSPSSRLPRKKTPAPPAPRRQSPRTPSPSPRTLGAPGHPTASSPPRARTRSCARSCSARAWPRRSGRGAGRAPSSSRPRTTSRGSGGRERSSSSRTSAWTPRGRRSGSRDRSWTRRATSRACSSRGACARERRRAFERTSERAGKKKPVGTRLTHLAPPTPHPLPSLSLFQGTPTRSAAARTTRPRSSSTSRTPPAAPARRTARGCSWTRTDP